MFEVLYESYDTVIKSVSLVVAADYQFALDTLVPLIDRLEFQRNPLRKSFYARLEKDIAEGCIMPFLTIAVKRDIDHDQLPFFGQNDTQVIIDLLKNAFILDGIQRLSILRHVASSNMLDLTRPIFFNILICSSMDRLLYRMITLNNGQRPMTARHQIEILADSMLDFNDLAILTISEKQQKTGKHSEELGQMSRDVIIKAYIAFMSNNVNIDNDKIISSKMDELLTDQIMESDITERKVQFNDVTRYRVYPELCVNAKPV